MLVRLAFAVQVVLDPEILIIDEALSVGDYFFQQKCFGHIRKMRENGLTLLFVSHDMGAVRDLCPNSIYLKLGNIHFLGDSKRAVRSYLSEQHLINGISNIQNKSLSNISNKIANLESDKFLEETLWSATNQLIDERRLLAIKLLSGEGQPTLSLKVGDTLRIQVFFKTPPGESGHISLIIKNRYDQIITNISTYRMGMKACTSGDFPFVILEIELDLKIEAGLYSLMVAYGIPVAFNKTTRLDETDWLGPMQINWNYEVEEAPFLGMFGLPSRARIICENEPTL
jgi:lipopolysaccharide transport system ATP-binding protein